MKPLFRSFVFGIAVGLALLWTVGCDNDKELRLAGPIVRISDKQRLAVMAEDIWPGVQEGFGFVLSTGMTGGLRVVTFLNFMDPGGVDQRLMAHVFDVPFGTNPNQLDDLASRFMREGMGMRDWHATRDGVESFSLGGVETEFERYAVVAADPENSLSDMLMYRLSRADGDQMSVLVITGGVNSFERPKTVERLHDFLDALPSRSGRV